jgi:hypothetical protein
MMYLSVMHFKWTNVVCLSMDMLISSMMDVIIISAKLLCHLCYVCKWTNVAIVINEIIVMLVTVSFICSFCLKKQLITEWL